MTNTEKSFDTIVDFITGKEIPAIGAEANRQAVEKFFVKNKGFDLKNIEVCVDLRITVAGKPYASQIDMIVCVDGRRFMAIKCAAGSLGSREREIIAAARILDDYQIPFSVVSDGKTAIVLDTVSGKKVGNGLDAIPSKKEAVKIIKHTLFLSFPKERLEREKLIFRSYDIMNVNVKRNISACG